jgi:hypothetical protein
VTVVVSGSKRCPRLPLDMAQEELLKVERGDEEDDGLIGNVYEATIAIESCNEVTVQFAAGFVGKGRNGVQAATRAPTGS